MVFKTIFRMPVHRLAGYTAAGALGVMTTGYILKSVKGKGLNHNPIYRQAIKLSKRHKGVQYVLGLPVVDERINLTAPTDNFTEGTSAYLRIPVHGPKGSGFVYSHFDCPQGDASCHIRRLELEITKTTAMEEEQYASSRLLIYDFDKHGPMPTKQQLNAAAATV